MAYAEEEPKNSHDVRDTKRRHGRFVRSVPLPTWADTDRIHARLELGVLDIGIAVPPETRRRAIATRAGSRDS